MSNNPTANKFGVPAMVLRFLGIAFFLADTLHAQQQPMRQAKQEVQQTIAKQLLRRDHQWYVHFSIKRKRESDPTKPSSGNVSSAPLVHQEDQRRLREGWIEFTDIAKEPSVRATPDRRNPGASRIYVSKSIGRYRVYRSDEKKRGWGILNQSTVVWNWQGSFHNNKLELKARDETKLGQNGPVRFVHGDVRILVAVLLGVDPSEVTCSLPASVRIPQRD
ncbi:MAG: hypothetical protein AAF394_19260 [Planctomycetota bacterium]